jgi:hypothetical protein
LATLFANKADLEKLRRDAREVPMLKEELTALREASSKIIPNFLYSTAFQVVALNMMKPAMLDQLHTILSHVFEFFPFKPEEFDMHETVVKPPSLAECKWDREADQLVSDDGTALSVPEILPELGSMPPKTPWLPEDEEEDEGHTGAEEEGGKLA